MQDDIIPNLERLTDEHVRELARSHAQRDRSDPRALFSGLTEDEIYAQLKLLIEQSIQGERSVRDRTALWRAIYLKLEETQFFLDQVKAHQRYPKPMFFCLSAFLSSARSVTFHIQKQILPKVADGRRIYDAMRERLLNDTLCAAFVELRNLSEKEMYPDVVFTIRQPFRNGQGGEEWPKSCALAVSVTGGLDRIEKELDRIYPEGSRVQVVWEIHGIKGHAVWELIPACEQYLVNLRTFVEELRLCLESPR